MFSSINVLFFSAFNLGGAMYGNPGDYAWGAGGLDAIITQVSSTLIVFQVMLSHSQTISVLINQINTVIYRIEAQCTIARHLIIGSDLSFPTVVSN